MSIDLNSKANSTKQNKTGTWRTYKPEIDYKKCIACGNCVRVCPEGCIAMQKSKGKDKPKIDYNYCKGCGICAQECPVKTIQMKLDKK